MKYAIRVVITTDEGQTETRDIACVEREDLTPTTLGLTLAEGKAILMMDYIWASMPGLMRNLGAYLTIDLAE